MFRFDKFKSHKSAEMFCKNYYVSNMAYRYYPIAFHNIGLTPFALCMPDEYKVEGDAVQGYRNYYNGAKRDLHKWTNRNKPEWIV
jgi:hypothetical protein